MRTVGICFGATTIQYCVVFSDPSGVILIEQASLRHEGDPSGTFRSLFSSGILQQADRIAITGRAFSAQVALSRIPEPEAVEEALRVVYAPGAFPQLCISAGGETQLVYSIGPQGTVLAAHSGNKCASGTGEFFLQQIRRMDISLDEAVALAMEGTPHKIAGRCSVFCKSDCTHSLNKGVPRQDIVAGLCHMMADKVGELIGDLPHERACLIGGGSRNAAFARFVGQKVGALDLFEQSPCFEAFGAAVWAGEHECRGLQETYEEVLNGPTTSFEYHPPLAQGLALVEFKELARTKAVMGDKCVLGLDVGSTTTKAVLLRRTDNSLLGGVYLRTNGDPVGAARNCYRELLEQLGGTAIVVNGLGVTGSGRQIAGLHALSGCVVNEIVAHATAAAFFDPQVDTIFEIGGQDAKYTRLSAGVPSDYAMNEACSAGTGSFLEEAARETLGVATEAIGELALSARSAPNFSDECAAFISSDIKRAGQEGLERNDILAGLVYSICLNYLNRVKGSRPIGSKVFMQGGVCYNRAVPAAMASLIDGPVVVAPEPGLMGALGVALETIKRQEQELIPVELFDLATLARREAVREEDFVCAGGTEKCDRKCSINRYRIDSKIYPFGGICDRYYNLRLQRSIDTQELDYVAIRAQLFKQFSAVDTWREGAPVVGLNRSFLSHSLLPLYSHFFANLGVKTLYADSVSSSGSARTDAAYCYPAQLAHGAFEDLLALGPQYVFVPQVMQLPVKNVPTYSRICVFVQGEPYYLKTTFRRELEKTGTHVLAPVLVMQHSYDEAAEQMSEVAQQLGFTAALGMQAWQKACCVQRTFESKLREAGARALAYLDAHPQTLGIVVLGRAYNAFTSDANMGIPRNAASRGCVVIPHDMLDCDSYEVDKKMFWAQGQKILKAAKYVRDRENLFALYITNFSCGPDSFMLTYVREIMQEKPSLTLELDEHTAGAGIDTRIEAFIDIVRMRRIAPVAPTPKGPYEPARLLDSNPMSVRASDGTIYLLTDKEHVEVLIPAMGRHGPRGVAAILRGMGINARALPTATMAELQEARRHASCKECLPYLVTSGSFLAQLNKERKPGVVTLLFLPTGGGPCRLGQYCRSLELTLWRLQIPNVAVLTVTDENGYAGLGSKGLLKAWQSIVVSDVLDDIGNMLAVTARNPVQARQSLGAAWSELESYFEGKSSMRLSVLLSSIAIRLSQIPLKSVPKDVPVISLIGEYYVRKDEFSRMSIVEYLAHRGFMVRVAPAMEYLLYSNYNVNNGLQEGTFSARQRLSMRLRSRVQLWWERRIKKILAGSGLYQFEMVNVDTTIKGVSHLVNEQFRGEALLTVGSGMREILHDSCGIISIGPFGCMPSRMSEAILKRELTPQGKGRMPGWQDKLDRYKHLESFPFLSIETDGKPFPQIVEANLEAFVIQARRLFALMRNQGDDRAGSSGGKQDAKQIAARSVAATPPTA